MGIYKLGNKGNSMVKFPMSHFCSDQYAREHSIST